MKIHPAIQTYTKANGAKIAEPNFSGQNEKLINRILNENPKNIKMNFKLIERTLNFLGLKTIKTGGTHVKVPLSDTEHEIFIIEHGTRKTSHFTEVIKLKKIIQRFYKPKSLN